MSSIDEHRPSHRVRDRASVVSIWGLAFILGVAIILVAPPHRYAWLSTALSLCVIATFVVQLSLQEKVGLVARMTASVVGALFIFGVATLVTLT